MLNLSVDRQCLEVEEKLIDYAKKYIKSEIKKKSAHKDDMAFGESVRCFDNACIARDNFYNSIDTYINGFSNIDDKKQIAGHFLFMVVNLSKYNKKDKRQSPFLAEGLTVASKIIEKYPLFEIDKKRFYGFVKGAREKKISPYALNVVYPKNYSNPMENKKVGDVVPSFKFLREYTSYLCKYASDCYCENVSVDTLLGLLKRNTSLQGLDSEQPTLFSKAVKKNAINKNAVLEVAEVFASSFNKDHILCNENNQYFDKNMEKMFCHIVGTYNYNPKEVEELKQILVNNSEDKKYAEKMAQNISASYIASMQKMKTNSL